MPTQDTSARPPAASPELSQLVTRLQALDAELVEHRRHLAFALDDLSATLEQARQVRQQLVALVTRNGAR
jgi:ABC-type transporter Mla subunit MlaD